MRAKLVKSNLRPALRAAGLCAVVGLFVYAGNAGAGPSKASRYPYDPVCVWGRLANGKGMLVRCLTKDEAAKLASSRSPSASPATTGAGATGTNVPLKADVTSVSVDQGKLPAARKKLRDANARYAECVQKEGGLAAATGEVHVRFLVRARGRAEGVSVAKRVSVSASAARCVAHVVDRRWVGSPAAPIVAGTAVIRLERR